MANSKTDARRAVRLCSSSQSETRTSNTRHECPKADTEQANPETPKHVCREDLIPSSLMCASCEPRSPTLRQSLNLSVRYHYLNVLLCSLSACDSPLADSLSRSFHPALGLGFERIFLKSACPENRSSCFALVFVAFALRVLTQKRLKNGSDESLWIL